jgi:hypothetical protein
MTTVLMAKSSLSTHNTFFSIAFAVNLNLQVLLGFSANRVGDMVQLPEELPDKSI